MHFKYYFKVIKTNANESCDFNDAVKTALPGFCFLCEPYRRMQSLYLFHCFADRLIINM